MVDKFSDTWGNNVKAPEHFGGFDNQYELPGYLARNSCVCLLEEGLWPYDWGDQ